MTSLGGCDTPVIWSGIEIAFGDTDRRQLGDGDRAQGVERAGCGDGRNHMWGATNRG
jgi:hypothetical protein